MPLVALAPDVWQVPYVLPLPGGVRMPVNMTVIRVSSGVVLVSPIPIDEGLAAEISALGAVRTIVAPSGLHHLFLAPALERWSSAVLLGPAALKAKRPDLALGSVLSNAPPGEWAGTIDVVTLAGAPKLDETVLFHRPSGTLVCADFVFHVTRPENAATRFALSLTGTGGGKLARSRAWWWYTTDAQRMREDVARVLAWPTQRIAMGHGEAYVAGDARERLARLWAPVSS